ncbi:malonyl-CoA decarboxylase [Amphritea sp. 1_MG-2023]|uniref:malonyl-CoA decarboxylase n=1 Tax=Amphritea sp. 1_MG-2023 TaxID=3062670 RepID=UPI0026E3ADF3|nr:malonyl-CoA decarboxylase [Amphritea sp. 1_MG-2023]MDO6564765.1 malonyl-CoA decarboxylase [Amphritea sp. 1_MG-2023]
MTQIQQSKEAPTLLSRTIGHLRRIWRTPSDTPLADELQLSPTLEPSDAEQLIQWMDSCLLQACNEVTARSRAVILGRSYLRLNEQGRSRFLLLLAEHYGVNNEQVETCFQQWQSAPAEQRAEAVQQLRESLDPPRLRLLTQFNGLPEGVKFLVDMRAELLTLKKTYPQLTELEGDLKRLLIGWFDIGLLQLEQITWQSSAERLEKLIAYEAVHEIQSWDDLKNRLDSDRRCFAFFHPNMPNEPLIFVEVALVQGLADNIQTLLDEAAPLQDIQQADTAIFYSISNAQQGLAGISFGNFLIKRVVAKLQQEYPQLTQFSTLSPMPGFCRWLAKQDSAELEQLPGGKQWLQLKSDLDISVDQPPAEAREPLLNLACYYLSQAKKRGHFSADPVAHFHLTNGAQIAQLNWLADSSAKGLQQSAGIMVNYLYQLPHIESRSQDYNQQGSVALAQNLKSRLKR